MPNALEESQIPPEFQQQMNLEVAHHVIKTLRAIGGDLRKTNDRPWNTYLRRPFSGSMPTTTGAIEIFRVPAGKYLVIENVTLAPVASAPIAPGFAWQLNDQNFDPNSAFSYATPAVAGGVSASFGSPVFVDSQETVYLWVNILAGTAVQGCLFGRLLPKDIREGLDISLPEDETNSSPVHVRGNL